MNEGAKGRGSEPVSIGSTVREVEWNDPTAAVTPQYELSSLEFRVPKNNHDGVEPVLSSIDGSPVSPELALFFSELEHLHDDRTL